LARYEFQLTGYADTAADLAENVNGIGGKRLLEAIRLRLSERGYDCDAEVGAEDWGWYFGARRNGRTYLCGAHVNHDPDTDDQTDAQAFLELQRGFLDRLFGRNQADPQADPGADLAAVLTSLPQVAEIRAADD
jgi:hypothetical protein